MKKSKFTEQQIAFAVRQAETGTKVKIIIRQRRRSFIWGTCHFDWVRRGRC